MNWLNFIKLFLICSILTIITNFPSGFTNSSINTAVFEFERFLNDSYDDRGIHLNKQTFTLLKSSTLNIWFVAQIIGAIISPFMPDRYGRKNAYLFATGVMTMASGLQLTASFIGSPELLIFGRALMALCSPLSDAVLVLYLQEVSPPSMRGMVCFLAEIGYSLMCVLGMILGMKSVYGGSLEKLLAVPIVPGLCSLVFLFFIPETPKYLMLVKKDRKSAIKSLEYFQGTNGKHERTVDVYTEELNDDSTEGESSLTEVFSTPQLRKAVFLGVCVMILTVPFYPILQSSTYMLVSSKIPKNISEASSTIGFGIFVVACILGTFFIDKFPRRTLILSSGIVATTCIISFVGFWSYASLKAQLWAQIGVLVSLLMFLVSFGMVIGPASWFIGPELVAQRHRATVFCTCFGINNVFIFLTNFTLLPIYNIIGAYSFLPLFVIPSTISLIFIYYYLPETLGRETHDIVVEMTSKKNVIYPL
ncbi:General substrate transporter family and Major facilitator superfamily domain, general substrate transporter and Major facilitator superfamily domain-containing protein [Strongyloides ratti]|uniref:General substrate transporter family and Major facilitator superfamily domain, general substrate transporter and Major facilitator superfamily domain-containing protein n=1 Tax=Strongyloides ratti TaxID=34506 RepID=A0A090KXE9_STRRB|nr:General substrate transporter family and Major facilitator superfamily domain, general substrate transporter and Major facilitator superfamily domain-containing protein [Strongyloides ratti]CEF60557.1 General substrate transporter family and Major facilitator superfamily domain, general substrate transporter and Major facilitator superfamily domain-containing protein [Strongyloides ratti]